MIVYVDLIFLLNLLIDGSLLLLTAWTRKLRARWWRLLLSASLGAAYVVFMLVPSLSVMYTFAIKCVWSMLMIAIAFGYGHFRQFMRTLGAFYAVSFAAAGCLFGLHYMLMSSGEVMNGIYLSHTGGLEFRMNITLVFVLIVFPVSGWLYLRVFQAAKQREAMVSFLADVVVCVDSFQYRCKGLIDTGNQLYDPLTKTPVMVVEAEQWRDVLPEQWIRRIREADADRIVSSLGEEEWDWQDRLRLVPYRGVNRGTQFMLAIKPDQVVVTVNENRIESNKVLVGFDGGKLCSDGSYQAIVHPALIQPS